MTVELIFGAVVVIAFAAFVTWLVVDTQRFNRRIRILNEAQDQKWQAHFRAMRIRDLEKELGIRDLLAEEVQPHDR